MLERIVKDGLCTGCGACAAALGPDKITMALSADGYYRPTANVPLGSIDDAVVKAVCGGLDLSHEPSTESAPYHPLWGPIARLTTGHATDPETRYRGSSGGAITAICCWLLQTSRISFVLSTSAASADPIDNETRARSTQDTILDAAGSRYAPSTPLADLETHLGRGQPFAFVGKPCDVAALRRMAKRDPRIDQLIPVKLSFFCAGVPSRKGTLGVLEALGVEEKDVAKFKYRGDGWPGLARATRLDGSEATMDYNSSWGNILNRHLQFRCKICADGTGEFADIACADAWYGKGGYPDFAERDGRSLIVARTTAGSKLLSELEAAGVIACEPLDVGEIERMQPYQADRKRNALARTLALRAVGRLAPRYKGFGLGSLARGSSLKMQARNFIGTLKRALK